VVDGVGVTMDEMHHEALHCPVEFNQSELLRSVVRDEMGELKPGFNFG
jgi:hypothetical protein